VVVVLPLQRRELWRTVAVENVHHLLFAAAVVHLALVSLARHLYVQRLLLELRELRVASLSVQSSICESSAPFVLQQHGGR
jgi:hypothetical protein